MENGVMLAAVALTTYGMPLVVELGIFFDVMVAVMVLGILVYPHPRIVRLDGCQQAQPAEMVTTMLLHRSSSARLVAVGLAVPVACGPRGARSTCCNRRWLSAAMLVLGVQAVHVWCSPAAAASSRNGASFCAPTP